MLKDRILTTLKFFDLQDIPLTGFEVYKYLLNDLEKIKPFLGSDWEVTGLANSKNSNPASLDQILECLTELSGEEVETTHGYYYLKSRGESFVEKRLRNYEYGLKRERRIERFSAGVRHLPFIRGVALGGSQALGQYKEGSDIDLLVITDSNFLWLGRVFITLYFQILGVRRYHSHIANRFCLNHYLAGPKQLNEDRNIYTAMEYFRLRPLYASWAIAEFKNNNFSWMRLFFSNLALAKTIAELPSQIQKVLEKVLNNSFGRQLERLSRFILLRHIQTGELIFVTNDELSFHPHSRKSHLFDAFFEGQQLSVASIDIAQNFVKI